MASNPNPVDIHVGGRIRLRRTLLGMSQEKLGKAIGLTFQQVQKYERGTNRVGSSRLFQLAKVLNVPVSFFRIFNEPINLTYLFTLCLHCSQAKRLRNCRIREWRNYVCTRICSLKIRQYDQ